MSENDIWPIIGIIILFIYPLFYFLVPYHGDGKIHIRDVKIQGIILLFKTTIAASLLMTLSFIACIFCFLRWKRIAVVFDVWRPGKREPMMLIQTDGAVIVGVLILLSLTSTVTGKNDIDLEPLIRGLTASVVSQFAVSAITVAAFFVEIRVQYTQLRSDKVEQGKNPEVETNYTRFDQPWGYKVGLLFMITGFITLILTMVVVGLIGVVVVSENTTTINPIPPSTVTTTKSTKAAVLGSIIIP